VDNNYLDLGMSKSGFIHTLPSGRLRYWPHYWASPTINGNNGFKFLETWCAKWAFYIYIYHQLSLDQQIQLNLLATSYFGQKKQTWRTSLKNSGSLFRQNHQVITYHFHKDAFMKTHLMQHIFFSLLPRKCNTSPLTVLFHGSILVCNKL
jgi:hypothetical protein